MCWGEITKNFCKSFPPRGCSYMIFAEIQFSDYLSDPDGKKRVVIINKLGLLWARMYYFKKDDHVILHFSITRYCFCNVFTMLLCVIVLPVSLFISSANQMYSILSFQPGING